MVFDRTENEPEEPDPEADFRDPDSDSLTIPRVDTEDAGAGIKSELREELDTDSTDLSTDMQDVPSDLLRTFWAVVLVVNAAVLALALGILLILFEGSLSRGGALLGGGVVLLALAVRRYRQYRVATEESTETATSRGDS